MTKGPDLGAKHADKLFDSVDVLWTDFFAAWVWPYVYKYECVFSSGWLPFFSHLRYVNTSFYLSTIQQLCIFRIKHMKFKRAFYWLFPLLIPTLAIYFTAPKALLISKFSVLSSPPLPPWLKGDSDITVQVVIHSFQGYLERCFSYKDCNQISVCLKGCLCLDPIVLVYIHL